MARMISKEELRYIAFDGIRKSTIVKIVVIADRTYYRLENGDFAAETPYGPVKTFETKQILETFGNCKIKL